MKTPLLIFYCLLTNVLCAQDMAAVEKDLVESYMKVGYWHMVALGYKKCADKKINPNDMQWSCDSILINKLLYYTNKFPSTLTYPFKALSDSGLTIQYSDDGLFRIYNWDTELGGTMHFYNTIFQFKDKTGVNLNKINLRSLSQYKK